MSLLSEHGLYTVKTSTVSPRGSAWQLGSSISDYTVGDLGAVKALRMPTGVWTRPYVHQPCPNQ